MIKWVFFDRDGTLTKNSEEWVMLRREKIFEWSGKELDESDTFFMKHYENVKRGGHSFVPYRTVEEELQFFKHWFLSVFQEYGIVEQAEERATFLTNHLWFLKKELYPETLRVLEYFYDRGYTMGVISDCGPSLELTLRQCGIHDYFTVFAASDLVGVSKPEKGIFEWAVDQAGVQFEECLYIDDSREEAEAAGSYGMQSFWLDRSGSHTGDGIVHDLRGLVSYVEENRK